MSDLRAAACLAMLLSVAGCGGGTKKGNNGNEAVIAIPPAASSPTIPTMAVRLSPATQSTNVDEPGSDATLGFTAVVAGTATEVAYPDVHIDDDRFALDGDVARDDDGSYRVRIKPVTKLAAGTYTGNLRFRLCRDAACTTIYPGSTQAFLYTLNVGVGDWTTFQRNAAHDGYVRATFDPSVFRKGWEWAPVDNVSIRPAASANGLIYVTSAYNEGTAKLHALSSYTGEQRWSYKIAQASARSPLAIGNGRVFMAASIGNNSEDRVVSVDAISGKFLSQAFSFSSQSNTFLQPTPYREGLYIAGGPYNSIVYGYDYPTLATWSINIESSIKDGQTPAVDDRNVYYYSGKAVHIINRRTGYARTSIIDPFSTRTLGDYYGAPILGSMDDIMAYSGPRTAQEPSYLISWSIADQTCKWRSANTYTTSPAVGNGKIYLSKSTPGELNALDEATGNLLWSWTAPGEEQMIGNTILTNTLVFVSTNKAIYAIPVDGRSHIPVWSAPGGGEMAITAEGLLVVVVRAQDTSRYAVMAYRLR